jgi:putative FmdB family regulatory protein
MPIYEYYCASCDSRFEKLRPISAAGQSQPCPTCAGPAGAAVTAPARISGAGEGTADETAAVEPAPAAGGHGHSHGHSHGPGGHSH